MPIELCCDNFVFERISSSTRVRLAWPPTCHVAQGGLELDILMPLPPTCGHYSVAYHAWPCDQYFNQ